MKGSQIISLILRSVFSLSFFLGVVLLGINIFGLTQNIRKDGLGNDDHEKLRFIPEKVWSFEDSVGALEKIRDVKDPISYALRANQVVHNSLVHVEWTKVDPASYRQLIPLWENYFLYALGKFTELPQFQRYHFSDYKRSFERGIGICGDAAIALSSILDENRIKNDIVSFGGHVIVEIEVQEGTRRLLDPDFGIDLGVSLKELTKDATIAREIYLNAGYTNREVDYLFNIYTRKYTIFGNTFDFMKLRYIFERASYALKWPFPIVLIALSIWFLSRSPRHSN